MVKEVFVFLYEYGGIGVGEVVFCEDDVYGVGDVVFEFGFGDVGSLEILLVEIGDVVLV